MKLPKFASTLVWLAVFGCVGMLYGLSELISVAPGSAAPGTKLFHWFAVLFLFGVWAGVVVLTERVPFRRVLHAALFAMLGYLAAQVFSNPTFGQAVAVILVCAVAGYFGENWVKHV
jgi:hypothetical protein